MIGAILGTLGQDAGGGGIAIVQSASGTTDDGSAGLTVPFGAAVVAGAGTAAANGTYTFRGYNNYKPYFNLVGQSSDPYAYSIYFESGAWQLKGGTGGTEQLYTGTLVGITLPWLDTWDIWNDGSAPAPTVTCSSPVTAGNSVIALISSTDTAEFAGAGGIPELTNNTNLEEIIVIVGTGVTTWIYAIHNVASGQSSVDFTLNDALRASMQILEVSGLADAAATDTDSASDNTATPGVAGLTGNGLAIIISAYANATSAYSSGPSGGYTRIGTGTGGASVYQESYYLIGAAGASTITLSGALDTASAGAVFGGV